jgi:NADH-quinone oxidoreductase subunit E
MPLPEDGADLSLLSRALEGLPRRESSVIPALQRAQEAYGYLPRSVLAGIARELAVPWASVYGVATFYAQFTFTPRGRHMIRACRGTACHVASASAIIEAIENHLGIRDGGTTEDRLFTLQTVACLGTCSLAPVMLIDDTYHGRLTAKKVPAILDAYRKD